MRIVRNVSAIILSIILIGLISSKYCFGISLTDPPIIKEEKKNMWKTKYHYSFGAITKHVYITNDDGVTMYIASYQDKQTMFVALGLNHKKEMFSPFVNMPPEYKSATCCWSPPDHFQDEKGIGLDNNSWLWMLNSKNGLTIDTTIVEDILENNQITWKFVTLKGTQETKFTFKPHQVKLFPTLIEWVLTKEKGE